MKQIIYSEKAQKQVRDIAQGDKKSAALIFEKIEQYAEGSANADVKILHGKYGEFKRLRAGIIVLFLTKMTVCCRCIPFIIAVRLTNDYSKHYFARRQTRCRRR